MASVNAENTRVTGSNIAFSYTPASVTVTLAHADCAFLNVAPEPVLMYQPSEACQVRGHVATGYTTSSASNLFVTLAGLPGNNTELKTQENFGFDLARTGHRYRTCA